MDFFITNEYKPTHVCQFGLGLIKLSLMQWVWIIPNYILFKPDTDE